MTATLSANLPATDASVQALAAPYKAATSTPLVEMVADAAPHIYGPFSPQLGRPIRLTINATGASGTAQFLRSVDGETLIGITQGGAPAGNFEFTGLTGAVVNEAFPQESEAIATYWVKIQLSAGSATVRVAQ